MPPKKPPNKKQEVEKDEVGYNPKKMTQEQLKRYARLLESEIEEMRKHCNFYQKMENELVDLIRIAEDELKYNEDSNISKDANLQKLKFDLNKLLQEKSEWPTFMKHNSEMKQEKTLNFTGEELRSEESRHMQEMERLKGMLIEKDKELETVKVKIEMMQRDLQERNEIELKEVENEQKHLLETMVKKFETMMEETEKDFQLAKQVMESEALESKISGERVFSNACDVFKRKLQEYYKEVIKQDLDNIKNLKAKIGKVERSIRDYKISLEKARSLNKNLKKAVNDNIPKRSTDKSANKFDVQGLRIIKALELHKKIETIALSNQDLEQKIKVVTGQIQVLRNQFESGLKRVRESAETKANILEKKLNVIKSEKEQESS